MDVIIKHFGSINNGKLYLIDLPSYQANLNSLEGKEVEVIIEEKFEETTTNEHAYYRGVIIPVALSCEVFHGWNKDELHVYLTDRFLGQDIIKEIKGIRVTSRFIPSTANIGKRKMAQFITDVLQWLATLDIVIAEPSVVPKQKRNV